jgi:hypothetical protein
MLLLSEVTITLSFPNEVLIIYLIHFIHQWLYSPLLGPDLFFSFVIIFTQTVGLLGRVISQSQGRYLKAEQHKHRINSYTDIPAFSGIRTHDPSFRDSEDSSYQCLLPEPVYMTILPNTITFKEYIY